MSQIYITKAGRCDLQSETRFVATNDDDFSSEVSTIIIEIKRIVSEWEGEAVVAHYHSTTDSWIFIALHDLTLGPAAGGTRLRVYPTPSEGLYDAFHLSEAMTNKWAMINTEWGGGKAVLALSRHITPDERRDLLNCYAKLLNVLRGSFVTAGDLGTTTEDLVYLSRLTEYVTAGDQSHGEASDSGLYTALGLRAAIRSSLKRKFGSDGIKGRTVLVQGLGHVGGMLARLVVLDGAHVLLNDLDSNRMSQVQRDLQCDTVSSEAVYETSCDVFSPCGSGGVLNEQTVTTLKSSIVCGGANNQLASTDVAQKLHERGILYAPDYVVNAGGAIGLTMYGRGESELEIYKAIEDIEVRLTNIYEKAEQLSCSPAAVADDTVKHVLKEARVKRPAHPPLPFS